MDNPFKRFAFGKSKATSQRATIIEDITKEINKEREGTKWKPLTGRGVAMKVAHLKDTQDIYFLYSKCKKAKSFGACFFGELRVKTKEDTIK